MFIITIIMTKDLIPEHRINGNLGRLLRQRLGRGRPRSGRASASASGINARLCDALSHTSNQDQRSKTIINSTF